MLVMNLDSNEIVDLTHDSDDSCYRLLRNDAAMQVSVTINIANWNFTISTISAIPPFILSLYFQINTYY